MNSGSVGWTVTEGKSARERFGQGCPKMATSLTRVNKTRGLFSLLTKSSVLFISKKKKKKRLVAMAMAKLS